MGRPKQPGWIERDGVLTLAGGASEISPEASRGSSLKERLQVLSDRETQEQSKHRADRLALTGEIQRLSDEVQQIATTIKGLERQRDDLRRDMNGLQVRLQALPDQADIERQWGGDRLAALWSTLKADRHRFAEMQLASSAYREQLAAHRAKLDVADDESVALLREVESHPDVLDPLPTAMRALLEERIAAARSEFSAPEPAAAIAGTLYLAEAPVGDDAEYILVIPAGPEALSSGDPGAELVNVILGAFAQALLQCTASGAPETVSGDDGASLVFCARSAGEEPAGVLGVALQECLDGYAREGWGTLIVEDITDPLLVRALSRFVNEREVLR